MQRQGRALDRLPGERALQIAEPHAAIVPAQTGRVSVIRIHALNHVHRICSPASPVGLGQRRVLDSGRVRRHSRDRCTGIYRHIRCHQLAVVARAAAALGDGTRCDDVSAIGDHRPRTGAFRVVHESRTHEHFQPLQGVVQPGVVDVAM